MIEYITDCREAIVQRNAHSYYAIDRMAHAAGITKEEWSAQHINGLTPAEKRTYTRLVEEFEGFAIVGGWHSS